MPKIDVEMLKKHLPKSWKVLEILDIKKFNVLNTVKLYALF